MVLFTILQWIENALQMGLVYVITRILTIELHRRSDSKFRFLQTRGLIRLRPTVRLGQIEGAAEFAVIELDEMVQ